MIEFILVVLVVSLFAQSLVSLYLMLYTWEHPERLEASRGPTTFLPPQLSFTALLPARHEEAVIYETIRRVATANYPSDLLEVVVICHDSDDGTIAEAERAIRSLPGHKVRVETFSGDRINKPRGLNIGFERSSHEVVTIFDSEDDIHRDVFNVVNTTMLNEDVGIVQSGVQLMNFRDHWFAPHNVLEYFFWFKSRLHFHADVGMIPLGGNTVFFRRDLLEKVRGWDEDCLTEDADVGIRLSTLGERIRVIYDSEHVTREETPESVGSFIKQRTRWLQGFIQVLRKGDWKRLPKLSQRILALYTLSYPIFQGLLVLLLPLMLLSIFFLRVHVLIAIISFLPLYALGLQFLAALVGMFIFVRTYGYRMPVWLPFSMAITFVPFQALLGISAVRAVYREAMRQNNWEKTAHTGAHRGQQASRPAPAGIAERIKAGMRPDMGGAFARASVPLGVFIIGVAAVFTVATASGNSAFGLLPPTRSVDESTPAQAASAGSASQEQGRTDGAPAQETSEAHAAEDEPAETITEPTPTPAPLNGDAPAVETGPDATPTSPPAPTQPAPAPPDIDATNQTGEEHETPDDVQPSIQFNIAGTVDTDVATDDGADPADNPEAIATKLADAIRAAIDAFINRQEQTLMIGAPVGDAFQSTDLETGELIISQYYERHRLDYVPELDGTPYEVLLGHIGREDAERRGLQTHDAFDPLPDQIAALDGCDYFVETSHQICGSFRSFWHSYGLDFGDTGVSYRESLALFGYPISEVFVDPETGVTQQYFERARLEYDDDGNIQVGLIRADLLVGQ